MSYPRPLRRPRAASFSVALRWAVCQMPPSPITTMNSSPGQPSQQYMNTSAISTTSVLSGIGTDEPMLY